MSQLTRQQRGLLKQRQKEFAAFTRDAAKGTEALVREVMPSDAEGYLANLGLFIRRFDDIIRDQEFDAEAGRRMFLTVTRLVGEYFRQAYGGAWAIDEDPGSQTFAHYVIDIPIGESGDYNLSPADIAKALVGTPAPRGLHATLGMTRDLLAELKGEA